MDYSKPEWMFDGEPLSDEDIVGSAGFVYMITNKVTGQRYIGRKYFTSTRKRRKTDTRRKTTESDWRTYWSSSEEVKADIQEYGLDNFTREVISLHKTKGDTNICEVKEQFIRGVIEEDGWYNGNINGKWRRQPQHIISARRHSRSGS